MKRIKNVPQKFCLSLCNNPKRLEANWNQNGDFYKKKLHLGLLRGQNVASHLCQPTTLDAAAPTPANPLVSKVYKRIYSSPVFYLRKNLRNNAMNFFQTRNTFFFAPDRLPFSTEDPSGSTSTFSANCSCSRFSIATLWPA